MRTTITISDALLKKAQKLSGTKIYSEAIVSSLESYVQLRERLSYLEKLFSEKSPHSFKQIKAKRKQERWEAQ